MLVCPHVAKLLITADQRALCVINELRLLVVLIMDTFIYTTFSQWQNCKNARTAAARSECALLSVMWNGARIKRRSCRSRPLIPRSTSPTLNSGLMRELSTKPRQCDIGSTYLSTLYVQLVSLVLKMKVCSIIATVLTTNLTKYNISCKKNNMGYARFFYNC